MSGKRTSSDPVETKTFGAKVQKCGEGEITLGSQYMSDDFLMKFKQAYQTKKESLFDDKTGAGFFIHPFTHCVLPNFLDDEKFLLDLQDELSELKYVEKNNDLYKFQQTAEDLKTADTASIQHFCKFLHTNVHKWLTDITGIELSNKVDAFAARYQYTDTLCCHDDELEGRRIAYILYLVPSLWSAEDGGALDLYDIDDHRQPRNIKKSIVPARNTLAFFEVSPVSFHQVAEVLSQHSVRVSVTGWFYGPPFPRPKLYKEPRPLLFPCGLIEEDIFYEWINPLYLREEIQSEIKEKFESQSEIELDNFLSENKYEEILSALKSEKMKWIHAGPANKRNYCKSDREEMPAILKQCLDFLHSDAVFLILSNMTGLKLHELAVLSESENSDSDSSSVDDVGVSRVPQSQWEVRRWTHGSYTLMHDTETETALDANLFFGCAKWEPEFGGCTCYIAKGEDEELLTVTPKENALALVYRDKHTLHFVKHVNNKIHEVGEQFFDIKSVYYKG